MTSSNIVLRIWWKISFVEYLISIKRKFLIIFNIDVADMGQRWRTFDSKWYEMEMMAKMKIDYVIQNCYNQVSLYAKNYKLKAWKKISFIYVIYCSVV